MSTDVAEGTVISQDPIGYTDDNPVYADPDNDTITLIVSSGSQDTSSQNTEDQSSSDTTAAVANGEVWKCTQKLKTPIGYNGGLIRRRSKSKLCGRRTAAYFPISAGYYRCTRSC